MPDRSCFERATPDHIRMASRSFSVHTAQSLDRPHVRHYGLLSDSALRAMAVVFEAIERLGLFPMQLLWMLLPLLEKPKGGLRPILLLAAPVRIWERLRRLEADDFLRRSPEVLGFRSWSEFEGGCLEAVLVGRRG